MNTLSAPPKSLGIPFTMSTQPPPVTVTFVPSTFTCESLWSPPPRPRQQELYSPLWSARGWCSLCTLLSLFLAALNQRLIDARVGKPSVFPPRWDKIWNIAYTPDLPCRIRLKLAFGEVCPRLQAFVESFFPYLASPTPWPVFPRSTSLIYHVYGNPCLRIFSKEPNPGQHATICKVFL